MRVDWDNSQIYYLGFGFIQQSSEIMASGTPPIPPPPTFLEGGNKTGISVGMGMSPPVIGGE